MKFVNHKYDMISNLPKRLFTSILQNSYFEKLKTESHENVMEPFFKIKSLRVSRKWWSPFFSIENLKKSHKAVVEFSLSFEGFKSHNKKTNSFFIGHAQNKAKIFLTTFSLSLSTEFVYYSNIFTMKKDVEHISVNNVRATFLLHK